MDYLIDQFYGWRYNLMVWYSQGLCQLAVCAGTLAFYVNQLAGENVLHNLLMDLGRHFVSTAETTYELAVELTLPYTWAKLKAENLPGSQWIIHHP
jgi:hypothetical protein